MSSTLDPSGPPKTYIVDSWPLIEMVKGVSIPQMDRMLDAAVRSETILLLSEMNLGEVFYLTAKRHSFPRADTVVQYIQQSPIRIVPLSSGDAMKAARLKAVHSLSYADAFTALLAIENRAPILTGDPDFGILRDLGIVNVEWLGA